MNKAPASYSQGEEQRHRDDLETALRRRPERSEAPILRSPDGSFWRLAVSDAGAVSAVKVDRV